MARFDAKVIERSGYLLSALVGCVLSVLALPLRAEIVPDLYAVSVPVAGQGQAELQRAAAVGLGEVAVRVTGRSTAANDPALASLFAGAMRYLDQYRYERGTGSDAPWLARLRFGAAQVDDALRAAGLPVWGSNRPALQVWLVLDDGGGTRQFVAADSPIVAGLRAQLLRRGLLLHLPGAFGAVTLDDVWQLNVANVVAAIAQNGAAQEHMDGYLIGRMSQVPGGSWLGSWTLAIDGQQFSVEGEGDSLSTFLTPTFDRIVDSLAAQYAVAANTAAEGIVVRVTGVTGFDDYAAIMSYLHHLGLIKAVSPVLLRNDELLLQLKVEGSTEQLVRQLALETRLTRVAVAADTQAPLPVALSYRWTPARS